MSIFTRAPNGPAPEGGGSTPGSASASDAASDAAVTARADRPDKATAAVPAPGGGAAPRHPAAQVARRSRGRRIAARTATLLAFALVLFALIAPNQAWRLSPAAFLRIPVEGLLGVALVLVLPSRPRRWVAGTGALLLGLLTVVKLLDIGFHSVLARPFDPVIDWVLFRAAYDFLVESIGRPGATGIAVLSALLAVGVPLLVVLAVRRLSRVALRHRGLTVRVLVALGVVWLTCAALGAQIVGGAPVAATTTSALAYNHARQVQLGLQDRTAFAAEVAADPFAGTPGAQLLTGLRGKDVVFAFVESYGRDAVEDPRFATQVGRVLADGDRRLRGAGFSARSGWLTSPTAGGGSWLAHSTLMSGLWIDTELRYRSLMAADRLTLNSAFGRAGSRVVGVMPGVTRAWPEASFYGYDQVHAAKDLGFRGERLSWVTMPDQFTLSAFDRLERDRPGRPPLMAEIPLLSSHAPWSDLPRLLDWDAVGDGSVFDTPGARQPDRADVRTRYRSAVEYSLETLVSYLETRGDDDLVLVFLGDHQPAPVITGDGAGRDVPITIVAGDPAVLDQVSDWGWQDGVKPAPTSPVWPMNTFRDRFLRAFGSTPAGTATPATP